MSNLRRTNKFPAGKEIGGEVYAHKAYETQFPGVAKAKAMLPGNFVYHVVKYNLTTREFSFIISSDFDTNHEPSVEGGIKVGAKGLKVFKNAGWIYHHKWLFVTDDYSGFDVEESKKRSEKWTALANVDKSRIGQRAYWETKVLPRLK
jgi:hypothetical protein